MANYDVEIEVRDYLREQEDLMNLLDNNNAQLNLEYAGPTKFNRVTLRQDTDQWNDYLPLGQAAIVLHCYGKDRPTAKSIANTAAWALRSITEVNKPLHSCSVEQISWLPTPEGAPMYVVTGLVTASIGPIAA